MKCPKCGNEMVWMGNVTILIKNTDKYFHKLSKKAFQGKDIEIWGVDWENGDLFCPNYLNCGNHPMLKKKTESEDKKVNEKL
jgi:hypothetical protein